MTTSTLFGTLHKAGFYYKGQGLLIDDKSYDLDGLLGVFENGTQSYIDDIKDNGVKVYLDQLDQIKKQVDKKNLFDDEDMTIVWMMNIYILTKLGYITNDNNNGTQFIYFNGK
jgi:hypothetical protein